MSESDRPVPLSAQIEAVSWAWAHAREMGRRLRLRDSEVEEILRRLDAALETLRTLQFGRETLR